VLATGRDWRLLRPRVDETGQALSVVLAGGPQEELLLGGSLVGQHPVDDCHVTPSNAARRWAFDCALSNGPPGQRPVRPASLTGPRRMASTPLISHLDLGERLMPAAQGAEGLGQPAFRSRVGAQARYLVARAGEFQACWERAAAMTGLTTWRQNPAPSVPTRCYRRRRIPCKCGMQRPRLVRSITTRPMGSRRND
jgi:hypothetical protein